MVEQAAEPPRLTDAFVSVIGVLDPEVHNAAEFVRQVHALLRENYTNYEIVLVDNRAAAEQVADVRDLLTTLPCVRVLRLSRHYTPDTAIFAGLEAAIGDHVLILSPAFDPPEVIPTLVSLSRQGNDIVQGISRASLGGSWVGKIGRSAFYWYNRRYLGVEIPKRATYLTALTRRAVTSLTNTSRNHRYLRHLLRHIGYRLVDFEYTPTAGTARRRTVKAGTIEAVEMISSYSTHPLRVVTALGVVAAFANLVYALYVLIIYLIQSEVAPGWTTTSLQLSVMFFLICIIIAVQAEYIGRILTETRREPSYSVIEELESETLISDLNRRNVSG